MLLGLAAAAGPVASAPAAPGRGYEMVSPQDKGGLSVTRPDGGSYSNGNSQYSTLVLPDGNGISYVASGAFGDTESSTGVGQPYLSQRGEDGWTTAGLAPPYNPPTSIRPGIVMSFAVSSDGTRGVVQTPAQLTPDAPRCTLIVCPLLLYVRDNVRHTYQLVSRSPVAGAVSDAEFGTATPTLDRVLFTTRMPLVDEAPVGVRNLYEWIDDGSPDGQIRLVGLDPDGDPLAAGSAPGEAISGTSDKIHDQSRSLSADGRRIFFSSAGQLYLREDGTRTVQVSASQRTDCADGGPCTGAPAPDPAGPQPAVYRTADGEHGSAVFFLSEEQLTDDARATPGEPDLYRYDVTTGKLADVTATAGTAANVQGLLGASRDARTLYFAATAQLVSGEGTVGEQNVYRWHDGGSPRGTVSFVATVGAADADGNWGGSVPPQRVSDDGRYLALLSRVPLADEQTNGTAQAYRYDAERGGAPECVSCTAAPGGSTTDASFRLGMRNEASRVVSDDGRVAFQTEEALRPEDTNEALDVYLFEEGAAQLVSSGASPDLSVYLGMDPGGQNVFFATREQLVAQDVDDLADVYVARIGGGFPAPEPVVPCAGDTCRGRPADPLESRPLPSGFVGGPGNVVAPPDPPAVTATSFRVAAISASQRRAWGRDGRLKLSVRSSGAGTVEATARARVGKRTTTVATAKATAKGAGTVHLSLRLSRGARTQLQRHGRLRVTLTVSHSKVKASKRLSLSLRPAARPTSTKASRSGSSKGQR